MSTARDLIITLPGGRRVDATVGEHVVRTDQPKDKWMKEVDFKKKVEGIGYKIKKFKQPGSCYEIYGLNKDGKKVEVYFNPVDASVVKEEID